MFGIEEEQAVLRVIKSGSLSGYQGNYSDQFNGGEEVQALEKEWCEYFHAKHAIFVNSATSGLWAACNSIGIKQGDEILVSPYTMTCSASMPLLFGAKPVFVDIEKDYYCMDPAKIEEKITDKTKAIIAVNIFGQPCDFDAINAIAKKYGLIVIEDAAQSIGATYKGKYAGTLSDIGVFSLNRHKHINCGEGGVITTNNDDTAFKLKLSINHCEAVVNDIERQGKLNQFDDSILSMVGQNLRGTELSAAIAREQLKKLDGIIKIQQEYAKHFDIKVRENCEHSYYRYAWIGETPPKAQYDKDLFNMKQHYIKPLYQMPLFKQLGYDQHCCPVCEKIEEDIILAWLKDSP
jgi:dTDP-4-amino-4,6-dideoxygalactose transaminase